MSIRLFGVVLTAWLTGATWAQTPPPPQLPSTPIPPVAERRPHVTELHGRTLTDDYRWLRESENPAVLDHLRAENAYADAMTERLRPLKETLYREFLGRIREADLSVPYLSNGYFYYQRTEEGKAYPLFCRRAGSPEAPEEIMLDVNELAAGRTTLFVKPLGVSPDNSVLAFGEDATGGRVITIRFKNLQTGVLLPDRVEGAAGEFAFYNDSRTFVFVTLDRTLRAAQVRRSTLGADHARAELVFDETDDRFGLTLSRTLSGRRIMMRSESYVGEEWRFASADEPAGGFRVIEPRRAGLEYTPAEHEGVFYLLHNDGAVNFALAKAPIDSPARAHWETVIPHDEAVHLTGLIAFKDHLVLSARVDGVGTVRVRSLTDGAEHVVRFPEADYSVLLRDNREYDARALRLSYASFVTPISVFDYDLAERRLTLLKEQPVLGGYDRTRYTAERLYAKAPDGESVPVSLVHKKGLALDGSNPLLLFGYGAYGLNVDSSFFINNVSLLDRGAVFAIAHVRGGSGRGRTWYEQGRLMQKKNTFTDFIAAAETLIERGYTRPERLVIEGGSAGGLLVGAVINMRPELFRGVVAVAPFVDLLNTMLDKDIPLTVGEYEQWGNPNDRTAFEYMASYSPYDQVAARPYPAVLVVTGLHDSNVPYWEAAKWVQRLREHTTSDRPILLQVDMESAHMGPSGRFDRLRAEAFRMAWTLDQLGITK